MPVRDFDFFFPSPKPIAVAAHRCIDNLIDTALILTDNDLERASTLPVFAELAHRFAHCCRRSGWSKRYGY